MSLGRRSNLHLLTGHDSEVGEWLFSKVGLTATSPYVAIGLIDETGLLRGGWAYNGYNGFNADLTVYAPGCVNRRTVRAMFAHAFVDLGCIRVTAHTARSNHNTRELLPRLGFKPEGLMKRYYGPNRKDDAFVFGMLSGQCPWLEK